MTQTNIYTKVIITAGKGCSQQKPQWNPWTSFFVVVIFLLFLDDLSRLKHNLLKKKKKQSKFIRTPTPPNEQLQIGTEYY
jgi:hypothetical protein